jgi:hypothetical protein
VFILCQVRAALEYAPMHESKISLDLDALRTRLQAMTDDELLAFGNQMHSLVYPRTYDGDGKPSESAFSIQLEEARGEWRRRYPKNGKA